MIDLAFHALVLETIDRCNARCAMCYQAAGPRGSELRGDDHLPLDVVRRVIEEAVDLPELIDGRVHVSGGEGFLNYGEMLAIFRHASDCGFDEVGATTNGFWAVTPDIAARRCTELAAAGVTYLEVSMDHWHLPYVRLDRVRTLLGAMRRAGLRPMLRTLSTRSHHMDELFGDFADGEFMHVTVANSRVQPVGRGAAGVPMSDVYLGQGVEGCCERLLNLTVTPNGNVYPCCAGSDMTNALASGNVREESLANAVLKMRTDYMIQSIIHRGTGELIPLVRDLGYGDRLLPAYSSICHLCWDVFKDDELAGALRTHFQDEHFELLKRAFVEAAAAVEAGAPATRPVA